MRLHLSRPARAEELQVVRGELRRLLQGVGASEDVILQVLVACGEACGNAIRHPIRPSRAAFEVEAHANSEQVCVMVRDFGHWRHEPTARDDPSGTGLRLMRSLMDDVQLKRTEGGTLVEMQRALRREVSRQGAESVGGVSRSSRGVVEAR